MGHHSLALSSTGNKNKCLCSFKGGTGERHNKQGQSVCVCLHVNRRASERAGSKQGAGAMFLNLCVGGEASPTQNALPHSLQPTQVFRCITFLSSKPLHQSSPYTLRESCNGDLAWASCVNQQSTSDLCYFTYYVSHTLMKTCSSHSGFAHWQGKIIRKT